MPANGTTFSESIASVALTSFRRAIASGVCDRASACSRLVIGATASSELSSGRTCASSNEPAVGGEIRHRHAADCSPGLVQTTQGRSSRSDQLELVRSQPADARGPLEYTAGLAALSWFVLNAR